MAGLTSIEKRNYESLSDEELVAFAKCDDRQATFQLISRYICTVEARAKSFSGGVSDDLLQEGLMGLLKAIQTFNPEREVKFNTYALTCVRNAMISVFRKNRIEADGFADDEENISDSADSPEELVIERERLEEIYGKIISALSELEWRVFQLYLSGLAYNHIALKLNVSAKVVDNAMQRVRRKLKAVLR